MFAYHELYGLAEDDPGLKARVFGAIAVIVALCVLLAFAPKRDATKVVRGMPCSILSETEISAALGAPMLLMPTSGAVCRYVSTGSTATPTLFVIARQDTALPSPVAQNSAPVHGVGDDAVRSANRLYVRYGARSYTFIVVPQSADDVRPIADELRVAKLVHRTMIAQNR
jgi:hypothetical protein